MILTVNGLLATGRLGSGEQDQGVPIAKDYTRGALISLAVVATLLAIVGVGGAAVNLFKPDLAMTIVSLIVAVVGFYALIGILKEMSNLDFITRHAASLSKQAREDLLRKLIADNSRSMFRLLQAVLSLLERVVGGK